MFLTDESKRRIAMPVSDIVIKGAREHNLRSVDLVLPRNQLICLTGVSGSGKSSLAFDTLYAEGQRRYVESLSSFARQFLGQMPKPDVDMIAGLSPSISISQKTAGNNPRSTVGTITEIYDYLRVLYARVGQGHCPKCERPITAQSREQILTAILRLPKDSQFTLLAPLVRGQKGEYRDLFEDLLKQGFVRARVDGLVHSLSSDLQLDRQMRHNIEVVVDRLVVKPTIRARLAESTELALRLGRGHMIAAIEQPSAEGGVSERDVLFSMDYACTHCGLSFEPPSPQLFSFNSPQGMCVECDGLGQAYSFDPELLIPDDRRSFKKGCFELLGPWKDMGRWRRHIYQGVADTIERKAGLAKGAMLDTPWRDLDPAHQHFWLWGTGADHITFTWRGGSSPIKYGGTFDGVIPELISKYRTTKSRPQLRQLEKYMASMKCPECAGDRLKAQARFVSITTNDPEFDPPSMSLPALCRLPVDRAAKFFEKLNLDETRAIIAEEALKEIRGRLGFLTNVGLDYLTLDRTAPTLSGGEAQRIRLAGQIGSGLVGVLYILDEPSIGLHARDNDRLLGTLRRLRDMGNTVVVVEHDEETMRAADHIIDFGPGPGVRGGEIVASGGFEQVVAQPESVTGQYLAGHRSIEIPSQRREIREEKLIIRGARRNNLKNIDVPIPLGAFVCVTGVSGSGKSSLVNDILVEALRRDLNGGEGDPGEHDAIEGLEHLDKLIAIDQSPIGRTPRSNPGTYIKVFDDIRNLFAKLPEAKQRGYKPGRFSFNVSGGRCEACEGNGSNRLEMDFLADVWVTCPVCDGHRYNRETLQVKFKDKSIAEVLEMDIQQALVLFENQPKIQHKLQTLHDVGLDYMKLGQPSPTLSGGEAQRIKLARELVKKSTGKTLYLLDEPTTGLHFADIELLLGVLHGFADAGNTVVVVEHNLDVIKTADWVIDLGPEGGEAGGRLVASGAPEQVAEEANSSTGRALAPLFAASTSAGAGKPLNGHKNGRPRKRTRKDPPPRLATEIRVRGAQQHNLRDVDATIPREQMTVFCGPSGSGKSSLAMDTIYAEGQRRYVESLSAYARQFVSQMEKPKVEHIEGLSPAIAIEQKNLGNTPRSTVGTVTEVYDYLRVLMARLATPHCPDCDLPIGTQTADQIVDKILAEPEGTRLFIAAPVEVEVGRTYEALWDEVRAAGYVRVRVDGLVCSVDETPRLDRRRRHQVEIVVDRIVVKPSSRSRIADSVESTLSLGKGVLLAVYPNEKRRETDWKTVTHSQFLACQQCGRSFEPLTPHRFSFNSPLGWCDGCEGLGVQTGANPAALLRGGALSLREGALLLWPDLSNRVSQMMLEALGREAGLSLDTPFDELATRDRRILMHGFADRWIEVRPPKAKNEDPPLFRFQFKGLYPALDEASRLSPSFRSKLEHLVDEVECSACGGSRLRDDSSAAKFRGLTIDQICRAPLGRLSKTINDWELDNRERKIAGELLREIKGRMQFLADVGLEYLSLGRGASTLSNGEAQRIRLASQLGSGLCGVLYVLDEPTIGLHPRDNLRLLKALHKLRDLGNTLVVVEHDREVIAGADQVRDFGPRAGKHGGQIVAKGSPDQIEKRRGSVTGPYLKGKKSIPIPSNRRVLKRKLRKGEQGPDALHAITEEPIEWLEVIGARHHNLREIDVRIPLASLTAVTGPSGSGKSSLINDVLYAHLAKRLHRAGLTPGAHDEIRGVEWVNKVIRVDQQPLGNSPTSNPATYTGLFELIRQLFAQLPEAKLRGYTPRRFSFNVAGGRCEECEGNGQRCIEMHFLPDVWVRCETCQGKRYNPETLGVLYHGHAISDVLELSCGEALELFQNLPKIRRILQTLCDVGLEYLTLGQSAPTLSGGEAQRVKLAAELSRPDTGRTLYLLDEPTTGLHFDDLVKLLEVMQRLVDLGNTLVVIEHNMDIVKSADWVIDLGPEAGADGGRVVACGTPEEVVAHALKASRKNATLLPSHTGLALAPVLEAGPLRPRTVFDAAAAAAKLEGDIEIAEVGRDTKMPWEIDGPRWHIHDRVGRKGEPCRWDGRILDEVVQRIHEHGSFSDTDWNSRTIVEIAAEKKTNGWFFHAITGEAWLLKMKFRVRKGAFKRDRLQQRLPLKSLNEMDDIPLYSNDRRVKVKSLRGAWQEVEIRAFQWSEIDTPEFWKFIEEAVRGFEAATTQVENNLEEYMPWKALGRKWHFLRKGFPPGQRVMWEGDVLEELIELLEETAPQGQFLWNNQQVVRLYIEGQKEPWASVLTKRPQAVDLIVAGPKNKIALGRIAELGRERNIDGAHADRDVFRLRFRTIEDLSRGDLAEFLREHLESLMED